MPHTSGIIPFLTVQGAAKAAEFYKAAFGFTEQSRSAAPGGKLLNCELRLGDAIVMVADPFPEFGGTGCKPPEMLGASTVTIHIICPDVDAMMASAVSAGATVTMPATDMFWGDRYGKLVDPFGHHWSISTHKEEVTPEEIQRRAEAMFAKYKP